MSHISLIRYAVARQIIHLGLAVMPPGRFKTELLVALWSLRAKVSVAIAIDRALKEERA